MTMDPKSSPLGGDLVALEREARARLAACERWLSTTVSRAMRPEWAAQMEKWRGEIARLRAQIDHREIVRVAMVGTTGAGKSSLLNAVLGAEVLPVGVMEPCTAFVSRVRRSEDGRFHAAVTYCTIDEWEKEIASLRAEFGEGDADGSAGGSEEVGRLRRSAEKRLRAVYGEEANLAASVGDLFGSMLHDDVARVFDLQGPEVRSFDSAKDMLTHVKKFVRSDSRVWPLVRELEIQGPFESLPPTVEIVDLPGLNDPNEARIEVTRDYLRSTPHTWVVFHMVRGLTEDIRRILREERLFQRMVLKGTYHGMSLVGTKADDVDANVADQLGLPEDVSHTDLVRVYCERTKEKAREQLRGFVREMEATSEDAGTVQRLVGEIGSLPVHATSADEFRRMRGIGRTNKAPMLDSVEATGIPGLHALLADIAVGGKAGRNAHAAVEEADRLVEEVKLFFRSRGKSADPQTKRYREHVAEQLRTFEADLVKGRDVASASIANKQKDFLARVDGFLDATGHSAAKMSSGWESMHWATLRALVHRDGVFRNSHGRNFDLSREVADCLVQHLPIAWEKFFSEELNSVMSEFGIRVTSKGDSFCKLVEQALELCLGSKAGIQDGAHWFQEKVRLLMEDGVGHVIAQVRERRAELGEGIYSSAHDRMLPTYARCREERGSGMKRRMLDKLIPAARSAVRPLFESMRHDLHEGLSHLHGAIAAILDKVSVQALERGKTMVANSEIDAGQAVDPAVAAVLESHPLAS